jgi:hypothetical protein
MLLHPLALAIRVNLLAAKVLSFVAIDNPCASSLRTDLSTK